MAESPWTCILRTSSLMWLIIFDLALPIDTGFWAYKCEGLWTIVTFTLFPLKSFSTLCAVWDTTSSNTVNSSTGVSVFPLIFLNSNDAGYYMTLTKVFNRPLCGIPKTISVKPFSAAKLNNSFNDTTVLSAPYPEYRLNVTNFLWRKWSRA